MRLIDADAFWNPFEEEKEELENRTIKTSSALTALKFIDFIKRRLDLQPTIVQPQRKKGKWIKISPANIYECSECGKNVMTDDISAYDFCHGCGADMRGESDEAD